jgi:hypothetical protein
MQFNNPTSTETKIKMTILPLRNSVNHAILRRGVLLIALVLASFALSQTARAVTPAPDGGYPGGNTAEGDNALHDLTIGEFNTAVGFLSLDSNIAGSFNTAVGAGTLLSNKAVSNTAIGAGALLSNTIGFSNTANGAFALFGNTTGLTNTGNGYQALFSNTTGSQNTAIGTGALFTNTTGNGNTATGLAALAANTIGQSNTANGENALVANTNGSGNTAFGYGALAVNSTGHGNTALGDGAGVNVTTASNAICIGSNGANVNNSCFIGNIRGITTQNNDAVAVMIDSAGQLGTLSSSRRYKTDIKPMDKASESILALKPVSFRYKVHKDATPQFGLIAEQVAEVNPDLVVHDEKGEIYTVRYDAVNAMLLNEFLKAHRKIEDQQATIADLRSTVAQERRDLHATIAQLTARLDEQAAQIQKVSVQLAAASPSDGGLEANKFATGRIRGGGPAPQIVNNP